MKLKLFLSMILLMVISTSEVFAQKEKLNFAGNWNFDKTESGFYLLGSEMTGLNKRFFNCSITKLVEHNEPELVIRTISTCDEPNKPVKTTETTTRYFTDGRGESNILSNGETVKSETRWDGNKIIITIYQVNASNGKRKQVLVKEISLSKNKQKLIEKLAEDETKLSSMSMNGNTYTKMVYKISK